MCHVCACARMRLRGLVRAGVPKNIHIQTNKVYMVLNPNKLTTQRRRRGGGGQGNEIAH